MEPICTNAQGPCICRPPKRDCHFIFIDDVHYNFVVKLLNDRYGIQVRGGCSCAGTFMDTISLKFLMSAQKFTSYIEQGDLSAKLGWIPISPRDDKWRNNNLHARPLKRLVNTTKIGEKTIIILPEPMNLHTKTSMMLPRLNWYILGLTPSHYKCAYILTMPPQQPWGRVWHGMWSPKKWFWQSFPIHHLVAWAGPL